LREAFGGAKDGDIACEVCDPFNTDLMKTVKGYAAQGAGGKLVAFEYELGDLSPTQVDVKVDSCGICHSDLSMLKNDWEMSQYPLVPGHEITGTVDEVGEAVAHLKKGDKVGIGWHSLHDLSAMSFR
jgi:uncharacterized zinc-type alcohol dehydrogenase-like protein